MGKFLRKNQPFAKIVTSKEGICLFYSSLKIHINNNAQKNRQEEQHPKRMPFGMFYNKKIEALLQNKTLIISIFTQVKTLIKQAYKNALKRSKTRFVISVVSL